MDIQFPITAEAALNVAGLAIVVAIACAVAKQWLKDWRYLNLAALGLSWLVAAVATLVSAGKPTPADWFQAFTVGLFAAALATLGAETIKNVTGLLGFGSKAGPVVNFGPRAKRIN